MPHLEGELLSSPHRKYKNNLPKITSEENQSKATTYHRASVYLAVLLACMEAVVLVCGIHIARTF